jgi:hypothetical protein
LHPGSSTGVALFLVLKLHLLSTLLAGLLIYELVRLLAPLVEKRLSSKGARLVPLAALSIITVALVILFTLGIFALFKSDTGNLEALLDKTDHVLTERAQQAAPLDCRHLAQQRGCPEVVRRRLG